MITLPVIYALALLALCGVGFILCLIADRWTIAARMKLGIILVIIACCAVIGMRP